MVQYKRKPIYSEPPKHFRNDDEVWVMEATGEAFGSYEEYLMRLDYYNQKKFTCEITGHTNLTFFEALKSERHGSAEVDSTFPAQLREPILRLVQFSTIGRIDDLVNNIYETFKEEFFQGESVQIQLDDMKDSVEKIEGVVRDKASFPEVRHPNGAIDRPAMTRYFVTVDMDPQSEALVDNKHVFRERRSFNKQVIRAFLKHSITRERWEGAPWLVKESLAQRYGIDTVIPQALQYDNIMAERKAHAALKRGRPDEQCLEFFQGEIPGLAQATKAYKGKLPQELVMHFQDALAGKVSPSAAKSGFFTNGMLGNTEPGRKAQPVAVPPPPPPVTIKYPIEDLHIYPRRNFDPRPALKTFPVSHLDSDNSLSEDNLRRIDKKSVGALLEIWNTLNVHSAFFTIDSFTFDDFVDAMLFREDVECELFNEVHCAILKILVDEKGNVDPAVPTPPETDEEEEETSAENSADSTPAPEPTTRQSNRIKKTSMLRNDISDELRKQSNGLQVNGHTQHLAEDALGSRSWIVRLGERDFRAGGWQTIVVGILHQLTLATKQNDILQQALAHLAPVNQTPCQETVRRQYVSLDVNLKVAALEAVTMLAITSRALKDSMETRMGAMTDMRKERINWHREKKSLIEDIHALDEQRRALYPEAADLQADTSMNGGVSLKMETPAEEMESVSASDSEDEAPHKGRRRVSSRANDLKRKREKEDELRREREKKAKLEDSVTAQYKSLTREIQKKEKEIKHCEQQVVIHEERLRVCTCHRTKVLGRDRYWNRYYWFERNGMPYAGKETSSTAAKGYANGRIWVQGPDDMERTGFIDLPPDEAAQYTLEFGMPLQKRQELEQGATQLHTARDWGYYDTPEAFDKLIEWLDERGHREKLLRKELQGWRDKVVEQMNAMNIYLTELAEKKASSEEPIIGIATRKKTYVDHNATKHPCLAWTNSTAKRELGQLHSDGAVKKVGKGGARGKAQVVLMEKPTTRASARLR